MPKKFPAVSNRLLKICKKVASLYLKRSMNSAGNEGPEPSTDTGDGINYHMAEDLPATKSARQTCNLGLPEPILSDLGLLLLLSGRPGPGRPSQSPVITAIVDRTWPQRLFEDPGRVLRRTLIAGWFSGASGGSV